MQGISNSQFDFPGKIESHFGNFFELFYHFIALPMKRTDSAFMQKTSVSLLAVGQSMLKITKNHPCRFK